MSEVAPTPSIRRVYDRLGELLDDGDDAFIEEGPRIVQDALSDPQFLDGVEPERPATPTRARKSSATRASTSSASWSGHPSTR